MKLEKILIYCLIFIVIFMGCTKVSRSSEKNNDENPKVVEKQKAVSEKKIPEQEDVKAVSEIKDPDPVPTSEGFSYGEWKFLSVINNHLPGFYSEVNGKVIENKIWILKNDKKFDPNIQADTVMLYDSMGNRIKNISYTYDESGNVYKYDDNNRLISITPIIDGKVRENKKTILKYFKTKDGNILRRSYKKGKLVLEEIETKIKKGWQYKSIKEGYGDYFYKVQILLNNGKIIKIIDFSDVIGNTLYIFEYKSATLKEVKTIAEGGNIPYRVSIYSYGEDGLLNEEQIYDPRKKPVKNIRKSVFGDYDKYGNWRKEIVGFDTGGKNLIIRKLTYATE